MSENLDDAQRIVLQGDGWSVSRHVVLSFAKGAAALHFLHRLKSTLGPTPASAGGPALQVSLGFSRRGLEQVLVPPQVLSLFALKAPAFFAGAARRASSHLGATADNAPDCWDPPFGHEVMDAVLSLHARSQPALDQALRDLEGLARHCKVQTRPLAPAARLKTPSGEKFVDRAQWVHFGYRDGLSKVGIEGWPKGDKLGTFKTSATYAAGEFLLGSPQQSGANPWIAGPGKNVWPPEIRSFFANGSFGVLQQVEQFVDRFEEFVAYKAEVLGLSMRDLKGLLCGRYPNGMPLVAEQGASPQDDFNYEHDRHGYLCPFGAHARRMNPRGDALAHSGRVRPLLRRGMPYGPEWDAEQPDNHERGLFGHFFCASIEDQYEHLIGQWAERVPLGSQDAGQARDPFIGTHEPGDGDFVIKRPQGEAALRLKGLRAFTRTRGTAYLFYPSLQTLKGIAENRLWLPASEDEE